MHTDDQPFMQRALALAAKGLYTTSSNPRVGCVIVHGGRIIGEGYHVRVGGPHAEILALDQAVDVRGATVYLTLEPCSYQGKTPPCCPALINAGVKRVVVAMQDPNPLVAGAGIQALIAAGIEVEVGLLQQRAEMLNRGFIKRMTRGLPFVRAKMAMSLDGRTAMLNGESRWITSAKARTDVQGLRAQSCAIVTGVETVILDDPRLTVRSNEVSKSGAFRQPLRVVVDSNLRTPPTATLLSEPGRTLIVAACYNDKAQQRLEAQGVEVVVLPANDQGRVDLLALLQYLAECSCNEVLLEAGSTLLGAFWREGLIDQLTLYMAPVLLGSDAKPLMLLPLLTMAEKQPVEIERVVAVGNDYRIDVKPV